MIHVAISNKREVRIGCHYNISDFVSLLPFFDDTFINKPAILAIQKDCPFPQKFSEVSEKLRNLSECVYASELRTVLSTMFDKPVPLKKLILNKSLIKTIQEHSFDNLIKLEILDLTYNKIKVIPAGLFQKTVSLRTIMLSYNQDIKLESGSFSNMKSLKTVSLVNNSHVNLPDGLFTNSTNLKIINLSGNSMSTFNG